MFYIDTHSILRKREVLLLHILPTIVVFVAFMGLTYISWMTAKANVREEQQKTLVQRNTDAATIIKQRLESYEDVLRGGAGLFNGSDKVTRAEWNRYLMSYNLPVRYSGMQAVGYISIIPAAELPAHTQAIKDEGYPDYAVFPAGERDVYSIVDYIEPFSGSNVKRLGYDMYTDPVRHAAMDKARDNGDVTISNIVDLQISNQPGFVMFMPLYRGGLIPTNLGDRRSSLSGYIFAPFHTYDLINKTLPNQEPQYGFQIDNLSAQTKQPVYESSNFKSISANLSKQELTTTIPLSGTSWQIHGIVTPEIVSVTLRKRATSVLWGGALFSFFVAAFIYMLLANRANALAGKEERGIQEAKDELLALASHQLRTPATGVKQYVGMLREGFAGTLTPTQQQLLDKAYESNERQLGTINEMLFVARADAGHLNIQKAKLNLVVLVREITEEQAVSIAARDQILTIKLPHQPMYVHGDPQYLRMALENIVSNASKYTKEGGRINIVVRGRSDGVMLRVADNGVGVAEEDRVMLFEKFSRIPNELTGQVSGSGIGLYLAKKVVDAHDGTIEFESQMGKGSIITIVLPKMNSQTPDKKPYSNASISRTNSGSKDL